MPREKSVLAQLPGAEQLRERAINYTRLAMAVVNESFALKLRALAEEYEDKAGRLNERQNR
jgi:hypothetical protein